MDFEVLAVVVASVVGSTGLASLITGGVQLSRASRLKKAAIDMAALAKLQEPESKQLAAANFALKVLTLDLVALRVVRVGARTWWYVFGVVLAVAIAAVVGAERAARFAEQAAISIPTALAVIATYVLLAVGAFLFLISRRRERLVATILQHDEFNEKRVVAGLPSLQTYKRMVEIRRRRRTLLRGLKRKKGEMAARKQRPHARGVDDERDPSSKDSGVRRVGGT